MKPFLIRHLEGEKGGRFPVWMMRQAGRYLPSYQAVRSKHTFWEMVSTPELAVKVSLLPLAELPVDAIIFFSDILTLPYGQGLGVEMQESIGPVVKSPLRTESAFAVFKEFDAKAHTGFVGDALSTISKERPKDVALFGFAGAPWTVGCYLVEGHVKKRQFAHIKEWMYRDPAGLARAFEPLAGATVRYLKAQHQAGVHAIQLFDTWLSEMPREFFQTHYLKLLNGIFRPLRGEGLKLIYFAKHAHHLLPLFTELEVDMVSVDDLVPLQTCDGILGGKFSLQGNLDPVTLLGEESVVRERTRQLVAEARRLTKPAVLNLGHGIFPETPVTNAKAFVEEAIRKWT